MTGDARHYSWPPFQEGNDLGEKFRPGNRAALTHGAWRARSWRPLADAIAVELAEVAPWTAKDAYAATVAAWSRTEAQIQLLMAYLTENEMLDGDGSPRAASHLLVRLEAQAQSLRTELGLSPLALSRLLAVADRRGTEHHSQDQELNAEIRRMIVEGRGVLDHAASEMARLTERVRQGEGEGRGRGTDDDD